MRIGKYQIRLVRPSRQLVGVAVTLALSLVLSFETMVKLFGVDPLKLLLSASLPLAFCYLVLRKMRREYDETRATA